MKKRFILPAIIAVLICVLCSCSSDKYSKKALCENLYSSYTADCSFVISKDNFNISADALLTKDSFTSFSIHSPKEYSGITITGDNTGNADTFCLELSDIPSNVDKSIASDLSLIFSLFSDEIPSMILTLDTDSFSTQNTAEEKYTVSFNQNGMNYSVIYTSLGVPVTLKAGNDKTSVEVTLSNFTPSDQQ